MENEILYHGSIIHGLKVLEPRESGFDTKYIYATDDIAFALIFMNKKRNSFQASYGTDKDTGGIFFCERTKGIFDKWYSGLSCSIYIVPKADFQNGEHVGTGKHEFISRNPVKIIKEIQVNDTKAFLMDLQKQRRFKFISYKNRKIMFPDDEDLIEMCLNGLNKYSFEFTLKRIRQFNPQLEAEFITRVQKKTERQKV
ncbi:hypothetical protein M1614_04045 [Candidatus Marsarchaeota archaeon]|jgi:hypothetical protein|nr:hypothetical protein [Candidatus Marsarchaeota archaeon]